MVDEPLSVEQVRAEQVRRALEFRGIGILDEEDLAAVVSLAAALRQQAFSLRHAMGGGGLADGDTAGEAP
jgi:hypothetical protein